MNLCPLFKGEFDPYLVEPTHELPLGGSGCVKTKTTCIFFVSILDIYLFGIHTSFFSTCNHMFVLLLIFHILKMFRVV